ncbi:hypothetical protein ACFPRL_05010 [Pseudoclavibacter helvolus]
MLHLINRMRWFRTNPLTTRLQEHLPVCSETRKSNADHLPPYFWLPIVRSDADHDRAA